MRPPNLAGATPHQLEAFTATVGSPAIPARTTGRFLITVSPDGIEAGVLALRQLGLRVEYALDPQGSVLRDDEAPMADVLVYPITGLALLSGDPGQEAAVRAAIERAGPAGPLRSITPEPILRIANSAPAAGPADFTSADETLVTWALQSTRADVSAGSGAGIRIAILDTGLDPTHPDLRAKALPGRGKSFVWGVAAPIDGHGHGTHCAGLACGPRQPVNGPRYGAAPEAELFVAKVVDDFGVATGSALIAGVEWAAQNACRIACVAIEFPADPSGGFSRALEDAAGNALAAGLLLIAAAGNSSYRPYPPAPVAQPANCPSVMATAALRPDLLVWENSNGGSAAPGGELDFAAPGVSMHSSWLSSVGYRLENGTSMATALTVGIAALWLQSNPAASPIALGSRLKSTCMRLDAPASDVGMGLVQAP